MKKILHITNWYPNKWDDVEALFVKEQFNLFSEVSDSKLLHVQVVDGKPWFKYEKVQYSDNEMGYYIHSRIKTFRIIEVLSTFLLFWTLFQNKASKYDLLHFHIAYPLLTYYRIWQEFIKIPVIISEHWSAYHFNFFMPKKTTKLDRMKNIFHQRLPVITVSEALQKDIQTFAGTKDFPSYVISNVIDLKIYNYKALPRRSDIPKFFIVNFWRSIKNPYPMLEAFGKLASEDIRFELRIGGYGPILEEMKDFATEQGLDDQIIFLGKMYKEEISKEMNEANAYLFASEYETFSVVCAQALSCGCPLIGPRIPAILEYVSKEDITLLESNDIKGWETALKVFFNTKEQFDYKLIAQRAKAFLSHSKIKEQYKAIINEKNNA